MAAGIERPDQQLWCLIDDHHALPTIFLSKICFRVTFDSVEANGVTEILSPEIAKLGYASEWNGQLA